MFFSSIEMTVFKNEIVDFQNMRLPFKKRKSPVKSHSKDVCLKHTKYATPVQIFIIVMQIAICFNNAVISKKKLCKVLQLRTPHNQVLMKGALTL